MHLHILKQIEFRRSFSPPGQGSVLLTQTRTVGCSSTGDTLTDSEQDLFILCEGTAERQVYRKSSFGVFQIAVVLTLSCYI